MFSLKQIVKISQRKFSRNKKRSFLTIFPVIFLTMVIVFISSEADNILSLVTREFFQKIETYNTIMELTSSYSPDGSYYTKADLEKIKALNHVVKTIMPKKPYVINATIEDLFSEKEIAIPEIAGLDNDFAQYYTEADFSYYPGKTIPIILNATSFQYEEMNWNGQDKIEVDQSKVNADLPIKTKKIDYDKEKLIGKEVILSVGGFLPIPEYSVQQENMKMTYTKSSAEEKQKQEDTRRKEISKYWDYDKLSQPQKYRCVVVAILEGDFSGRFYVPSAFINILNEQSIKYYQEARNNVEIPQIELLSFYYGWEYNGKSLQRGGVSYYIESSSSESKEVSYEIPGLIVERTERTRGLPQEMKEVDFNTLETSGELILIQIDHFANRETVSKELNDQGYPYWDVNPEVMFLRLKRWVYRFLAALVGIFVFSSLTIILVIMGKFVDEARREIGIFRAIGATKGDIRHIYIGQATFYVTMGLIIGLVIGALIVAGISFQMNKWFNTLFNELHFLSLPFLITVKISYQDFLKINWLVVGGYSFVLIFFTLLTSFIPAGKAAKVSPVEAIKNE